MTDQEKMEKLAALVAGSKKLLEEAKAFADEHSLSFRWDDSYGSKQQTYNGKGSPLSQDDWNYSDGSCYGTPNNTYDEGTWTSSSDDC